MITENGLWFCDKCKSLLVEHESWFVEIASEHLCVCCAENEIVGLREQLRWRKWPEEKPVNSGRYLVLTDGSTDIGNHLSYWSRTVESWSTKDAGIAFWRPIGPLPLLNMPVFSKESVAMYECKCGAIKNTNEPCLNCGPLPGEGGE